jgi:hypothetical protein
MDKKFRKYREFGDKKFAPIKYEVDKYFQENSVNALINPN